MAYRFKVEVEGRPDLSGTLYLEKNYREGDRLALDGVPLRVMLRAEDPGDQVDAVLLKCVQEDAR